MNDQDKTKPRLIEELGELRLRVAKLEAADQDRKRWQNDLDLTFHLSPMLMCIAGLDGYLKRVNPVFQKTFGYAHEELLTHPYVEFMHSDDRAAFVAHINQLANGLPLFNVETHICRPDDSVRLILWSGIPLTQAGTVLCIGQDITDRKRVEESLRESEERFRAIFDSGTIGVVIAVVEGKVQVCNRAFQELVGYSAEELRSKYFGDYTHPDDLVAEERLIGEMLAGTRSFYQIEKRYIRSDGNVVWARQHAIVIRDGFGKATGGVCVIEDITARKQAEVLLRESEEKYRAVVEDQTEVIIRLKVDGTILFANDVFCRFFGKKHDKLLGKQWQPLAVAEDVPLIEEQLRRLSTANPVMLIENRVYTGDGHVRWMQFANRGFFDNEGSLTEIQVVGRDITDRKKLEEELRRSEYRQRAILDTIPDPAWLKNKEGRFLAVNAAWCRFFGVDAEAVFGKTASAFAPPEVAEEFREQDRGVLQSRHPLHVEELLTGKDGRPVWFETIKTPLFNDHGEVVGTTGLARDITERKVREREIARLNRLYAALSELNQIIVRVTSREELFQEVCRVATQKAGFRFAWVGCPERQTHRIVPLARDGQGHEYLDEIEVYADDRPEGRGPTGRCIRENRVCVSNDFAGDPTMEPWQAAAAKRGFQTVAALPIRLRGTAWGTLTAYGNEPYIIHDKEIALLEDAASAISLALERLDQEKERKQMQEALHRSEASLAAAQRIAHLGSWEWDVVANTARWSDETFRMFGMGRGDLEQHRQEFLDRIHPEDRTRVDQALSDALSGAKSTA